MTSSNNDNLGLNNAWEDLRRKARQLENDIDLKLFTLSKTIGARNEQKYNYESQPLLNSDDDWEHLSSEIDELLFSLQDVNSQMSQSQSTQSFSNSNGSVYTLQRHQEILNDYRKEFNKLHGNIQEQVNRNRLMGNIKKNDHDGFSFSNRKNDHHLMKEADHIRNSEIMIDDQINIAMRTRDTLRNQRSAMKSIQTHLTTLANKFPMLNSVMHRIGVKKRKDSLILALVIGVCLFFTLYWIFFH